MKKADSLTTVSMQCSLAISSGSRAAFPLSYMILRGQADQFNGSYKRALQPRLTDGAKLAIPISASQGCVWHAHLLNG